MNVSTKELRIQPGKIIEQVVNGEEITITFRGKALAKIVPIQAGKKPESSDEDSIFGMWSSHSDLEDPENMVRSMREGRRFDY